MELPRVDGGGCGLTNSNLEGPRDIGNPGEETMLDEGCGYMFMRHSCMVLRAFSSGYGGQFNAEVERKSKAFEM